MGINMGDIDPGRQCPLDLGIHLDINCFGLGVVIDSLVPLVKVSRLIQQAGL